MNYYETELYELEKLIGHNIKFLTLALNFYKKFRQVHWKMFKKRVLAKNKVKAIMFAQNNTYWVLKDNGSILPIKFLGIIYE